MDESNDTGMYFDEKGEPMLGSAQVRGAAFAARVVAETRALYNVLGIPIAAGVLYPAFGILLGPVVAALAMSFSSVSVITNALRLPGLRLER